MEPQLIFLIGPVAVGKMTVGLELSRLSGMRLLHNHMTIDPITPIFDFGTPSFFRLVRTFRLSIIEEVAQSDLPGLLFTYVWGFDQPGEQETMDEYAEPFRRRGRNVRFVELQADQTERLHRNRTELRLEHKRSKRDLEWSEQNLLEMDRNYQLAAPEEIRSREDWLHLDTTNLTAAEAAARIVKHYAL